MIIIFSHVTALLAQTYTSISAEGLECHNASVCLTHMGSLNIESAGQMKHLPACSSARHGWTASATATDSGMGIETATATATTTRTAFLAAPCRLPQGPRKRAKCIRLQTLSAGAHHVMVPVLGQTSRARVLLLMPLRLQPQQLLAMSRQGTRSREHSSRAGQPRVQLPFSSPMQMMAAHRLRIH